MSALVLVVAGCELLPGMGQQQDRITRAEAVEIALGNTDVSDPVVTEVVQGQLNVLRRDPSLASSTVWAVTVHGGVLLCPPNGAACSEGPGQSTFYIEQETGDWLATSPDGEIRWD